MEKRNYNRFTFVENDISSSPKVPTAKFLGSGELVCFISIYKFSSFKNPHATITRLSKLSFRFMWFILLVQMKRVISMNYGSSTGGWKKWRSVRLDLVLTMRDIYINSNLKPPMKFTSNSRNTEFKDILPWNISQMITKIIATSTRIVTGYVIYWDIPFSVWRKVNGNWDNEHGQNFSMEWKSFQKKY